MNPQASIQLEPLESYLVAQFVRYLVPDEQHPHASRQFLMDFALETRTETPILPKPSFS